jgi:hypothetical protein
MILKIKYIFILKQLENIKQTTILMVLKNKYIFKINPNHDFKYKIQHC